MKEYAERLYKSKRWQRTAKAYAKSQQNLCELCRQQGLITPGEIVHHKVAITPENIDDPSVALSWENLQLVCRKHHAEIHDRSGRRWKVDEFGRVTAKW